MGKDLKKKRFTQNDHRQFLIKLKEETALLKKWFEDKNFKCPEHKIGIELEGWLADKNMKPDPAGEEFIEHMRNEQVVPELARFNFEINSNPYRIDSGVFSSLHQEMEKIWRECEETAALDGHYPLVIGSLATFDKTLLNKKYFFPRKRYLAMNEQVLKFRDNRPFHITIDGEEELDFETKTIMTESAATSLQIHLTVEQSEAKDFYNASVAASSFMAAIAANSPFFLGKELWDESRIPIFEQSAELVNCQPDGLCFKRAGFGEGYIEKSMFELFEINLDLYPILLPQVSKEEASKLAHLQLHNGTVWRWNRPVTGFNRDGSPHLRVEHRAPSAGPTILDTVANSAFYLGLVHFLAGLDKPIEKQMSFETASDNFYKAAQNSFNSEVQWIDGRRWNMRELLLAKVFQGARQALVELEISKKDVNFYMDGVILPRIEKSLNGAAWQKNYIHKHGKNFQKMIQHYIENQKSGKPVHLWDY